MFSFVKTFCITEVGPAASADFNLSQTATPAVLELLHVQSYVSPSLYSDEDETETTGLHSLYCQAWMHTVEFTPLTQLSPRMFSFYSNRIPRGHGKFSECQKNSKEIEK